MTQIVKFPDKTFGRLASIADNRGVSIADLIVEAAQGLLSMPIREPVCELEHVKPARHTPGPRPLVDTTDEVVAARIRSLIEMDRSLPEVAREFGVSADAMRTAYRHLGIERNRINTNPKESN